MPLAQQSVGISKLRFMCNCSATLQFTVTGQPGIGKTALLREVAHYFYQRASSLHFTGVFYVEVRPSQDLSVYSCVSQILSKELLNPKGGGRFPEVFNDKEFFSIVGASPWLLVLDGIENLLDDGRLDFPAFLRSLFDRCPKIKVLIGSRKSLDFTCSQTTEKHFQLGVFHAHDKALMKKISTDLLVRIKSRPFNLRDYNGLGNGTNAKEALMRTPLIELLGGHPMKIVDVAARMKNFTLGEIYRQLLREKEHAERTREKELADLRHRSSLTMPMPTPMPMPSDNGLSAEYIWTAMVDEHLRCSSNHHTSSAAASASALDMRRRLPLAAVLKVTRIYFSRVVDPAGLRPLSDLDLKEIESMIVEESVEDDDVYHNDLVSHCFV